RSRRQAGGGCAPRQLAGKSTRTQSRWRWPPAKPERTHTQPRRKKMTQTRLILFGAVAAVLAATPRTAAAQKTDDDSVIVSTAWLARHLSDPKLVVLYVGHDTADAKGDKIPGSRLVSYMDITTQHDG